ncbi:uncharacterized protein LOC8284369 [Ricinus communis]|uniref:Uncharacterized protein n=1 Tax=Ricinus communis TaxID=3988 RepID=B9RHD3_RICCO|nr:uncharacterized protein LOC8284369 [Ricinus communis]EEF49495.1 conserved hypothetical protein [Ricinus communis]|eukprot:XP_002512992.1 uncharacterized protein LOC8284369 [Ricinus communis]
MASSDDVAEGSISSVLIASLKSNQNDDALSPEEIAWVDSCLVKDPDTSDDDWSSMKDALLDILGLQAESHNSLAPESDGLSKGIDIQMLSSAEPGIVESPIRSSDDDSIQTDKEMDESNYDFPVKEEFGISLSEQSHCDASESSLKNAFLPHYRENNQNVEESIDSGLNFSSSTYETEPSIQDIFKVWDLGIPSEEYEFIKQLNKALSESSVELMPPMTDDSGAWKESKDDSVDDLIAGIAYLSLNLHSK